MILYNLKREAPWFFQHIENYYHLFMNIKFENKLTILEQIEFSVELSLEGFEGLIFYMYKPTSKKIKFNVYKHSIARSHEITNLPLILDRHQVNSLDFAIIPFGYFKEEHKFRFSIKSKTNGSSFDIYSWAPSNLYKNVKSVIKIDNQYLELIPIDDFKGYFFQVNTSFKGNETGRLFDLINYLVELDKMVDEVTKEPLFEHMDSEIKALVTKSNEILFELSQKTVPLESKNIIRELERLKFNIDNLSKEEIFNWLDDLIDFYSDKS
ncbi:MAG: hypothetical protein ACXABO_04485 [Promethearchaeota archaeon]|jgi:hypothetical protein